MKTYIVGMTIRDAFCVEAMTEAEAWQKVCELDMDPLDIITHDADLNFTYTMEEDAA